MARRRMSTRPLQSMWLRTPVPTSWLATLSRTLSRVPKKWRRRPSPSGQCPGLPGSERLRQVCFWLCSWGCYTGGAPSSEASALCTTHLCHVMVLCHCALSAGWQRLGQKEAWGLRAGVRLCSGSTEPRGSPSVLAHALCLSLKPWAIPSASDLTHQAVRVVTPGTPEFSLTRPHSVCLSLQIGRCHWRALGAGSSPHPAQASEARSQTRCLGALKDLVPIPSPAAQAEAAALEPGGRSPGSQLLWVP